MTNSIETFGQKLIKVISDVCFTFFVLAILVITMIAFGQKLIKVISDVCFTFFMLVVLVITVIAITYQPPDPWLESSKAMSKVFSAVENATFKQDDSILRTGEDIIALAPTPAIKEE